MNLQKVINDSILSLKKEKHDASSVMFNIRVSSGFECFVSVGAGATCKPDGLVGGSEYTHVEVGVSETFELDPRLVPYWDKIGDSNDFKICNYTPVSELSKVLDDNGGIVQSEMIGPHPV